MSKRLLAVLTMVLLISLAFSGPSFAASPSEVWVDLSYDADTPGWQTTHFDSIQDGLNAVAPEGTVYVMAGIYGESIIIDKTLTLQGETGATIELESGDYGITVENSGVIISGMKVMGAASAAIHVDYDAFTYLEGPFDFTLTDSSLVGDYDTTGILFSGDTDGGTEDPSITGGDILIQNSTLEGFRRGIDIESNVNELLWTDVVIQGNTITDLSWDGIYLSKTRYSTITVSENAIDSGYSAVTLNRTVSEESVVIIADNTLVSDVEAVYIFEMDDSVLTIENNNIESDYDGIYFSDYITDSTVTIENNTIEAGDDGIYFSYDIRDGSTVSILFNIIDADEDGIDLDDVYDSSVLLEGNTIVAGYDGITLDDNYRSTITVKDNTITAYYEGINFYDYHDGSVLIATGNTITTEDDYGMYICCIDDGSSVTLMNNTITSNYEGIYFSNRIREESTVVVKGNIINSGDDGIYFSPTIQENSTVSILDNTINASVNGIYFSSSIRTDAVVLLQGNTIENADQGVYFYSIEDADISIIRNAFRNNDVALYFNTIDSEKDVTVYIFCNTFSNNGQDLMNNSSFVLELLTCPTSRGGIAPSPARPDPVEDPADDEDPAAELPLTVMLNIGRNDYLIGEESAVMDVAPFVENGRTFVPVRFIAEAFGADVLWSREGGVETVSIKKDGLDILITIGSPAIQVTENGAVQTVTSDVAPFVRNGRTWLPLRAIGEILGAQFDWGPKDGAIQWVSIIR